MRRRCRGVGLDVTSWGFELEIKIKRGRPLRIMEGLQAPRVGRSSCGWGVAGEPGGGGLEK